SGPGRVIQALAVALASWNGVALGLVISALASNADKAMSVVPLVLMPQIMLAGVMAALPELNTPTWLASHLVVTRWANQAQEIGLLQGRKVDEDLLDLEKSYYIRSLWNLYPEYNVTKPEDKTRFMAKFDGIDRISLLIVAVVVLALFLSLQLGAGAWILRRQAAW